MAIDVEAGEDFDASKELYFDSEMDIDSDVESTFSSSAGSAQSFFTVLSSPPQPTYSLPALGAIELDIEMEDVFEMAEEPFEKPYAHSSLVPAEHQTFIESTTPPGSPSPIALFVSPSTTTPSVSAKPDRDVFQIAPVDYYARAADEDFIEAQRQAENKPLPESDDTDLEEGPKDDLGVPANTPLPGSDEEDIHLAESPQSEIIAWESDHTLTTRPQVVPQGENIPDDTSTPPATEQQDLAEPIIHIDTEMGEEAEEESKDEDEDEEEDEGVEWETVFDVNGVTAPQAPVSNPVAAAPSPSHGGSTKPDLAYDAEDTSAPDDEECSKVVDDYFVYDVESAQEIMDDFLCEKLPELAAQVLFPATNFTATAQAKEAELFAAWLHGTELPEEASSLVEAAFEEQAEMSGEELGDLIWNWYEERVFAELQGYEVPFSEEDTEALDERIGEVLEAYFDESLSEDNDA
jgi:hypothetical protein